MRPCHGALDEALDVRDDVNNALANLRRDVSGVEDVVRDLAHGVALRQAQTWCRKLKSKAKLKTTSVLEL